MSERRDLNLHLHVGSSIEKDRLDEGPTLDYFAQNTRSFKQTPYIYRRYRNKRVARNRSSDVKKEMPYDRDERPAFDYLALDTRNFKQHKMCVKALKIIIIIIRCTSSCTHHCHWHAKFVARPSVIKEHWKKQDLHTREAAGSQWTATEVLCLFEEFYE